MRTLILAGVCALAVATLAACGGSGGGTSRPAAQTIRGAHFVFQAPSSWHVKRRGSQVGAAPKPIAPELVSVSVFPLLRAYRPALFAAVSRELDGTARQLATRLGGYVSTSGTTTVAGIRSRQYGLFYTRGKQSFRERITFVLRGKTEFQLLCQWDASKPEPSACGQLTTSFTPM